MKKNKTEVIEEKEQKRIKNYIILLLVFLVSMGFVLYLRELYKVNEEEQKKTPIIGGMIYEIYNDDLEHYLLDNPTTVIYMCTANGDTCRLFERDFKKLLKKEEYNEQLVYLNLTDLDQEKFVDEFNKKYNYKTKLTSYYPAFVLFENGEIKKILQGNENNKLSIEKVRQFLEINEIGE